MKNIAVMLSGCGVYDGSEIHEAVLTLLAIEQAGAKYRCFAPNINQHHVINHLTGEVMAKEQRNVLVESARIARGDVEDLTEFYIDEFDALIVPGGFGAAKNLSDFAINAEAFKVNEQVMAVCQAFVKANKPAGYMCIAPVMIPLIYGENAQATIGHDVGIAKALIDVGLAHRDCAVDDIVVDTNRKLVSTPAYMLATTLTEAASGINKLVAQVIKMMD
ncbi:isoprenoid biosynthesis glyoxalase ElbB [Colwellia sp. MB02u-9]|uniref:isoprenoid biosynthesis glyoxalase ElbB n=1 Tax=Colwellia sp. MB02u-9 TaxID=2759823 RepID=UPI0015F4F339|nr:isoprenoid biosynthesis glyoxalase ElbB [Colwellia sp. MB02u-9]MBA6297091.1 isoprenoid biosynthesis glyoxalase ElbB [Colwellia sp. MB02u-9]